ncbi:MAG: NAD+ synthase [Acidimicrobiia bacterium]|nr:NAD+ synthase [Acidimicrobiia bacterium]NNF09836.1 NAD+ synthase [Acidimicrobiia bacterium]NNL71089.1 NAD+ synthase [Acidimicrobiia bacterium]
MFIRVAGAQLNQVIGDLAGNRDRILDAMAWAQDQDADVLALPELAVTGYPPEDLLLRESFIAANLATLQEIAAASGPMLTVVGFVDRTDPVATSTLEDSAVRSIANAAALLYDGEVRGVYHKVHLPNFGVFDEQRYFVPGVDPNTVWGVGDATLGVSVCEDIWVQDGPPLLQAKTGAQVLININASPYHFDKHRERLDLLSRHVAAAGVPLIYVNQVGGQDELVFDGGSMILDSSGAIVYQARQFEEDRFWADVELGFETLEGLPGAPEHRLRTSPPAPPPTSDPRLVEDAEIYAALTLGLRDYVQKNEFPGVVLGLSGGIDSALSAAIAVDALGADRVWGVAMPSPYSSEGSITDSAELARRLGCRFDVLPIDGVFDSYRETLADVFAGTASDVAEENLQSRIRGALLMALSNKFGPMVLTTGNKSEMAVGYATLYGDMVGGYSVLKDVLKLRVYRLARWRNETEEVIPQAIIDKPPSAELKPDQLDTDSLPPYEVLDEILERYVERDLSIGRIVADGFDEALVERITRLVDRNEYKRRQSPPGVKITTKAFGKDRRLPITNWYRSG